MSTKKWNTHNIPPMKGKRVIVTGASSGIGKVTARELAAKGAAVILAVRDVQKGELVASEIRAQYGEADLTVGELDLASLSSIISFGKKINDTYNTLDLLINNAGVMFCPFDKTKDGFEMQMGTNHLGHFALTAKLLPLLRKTENSRIIVVSSFAHQFGDIDFTDLNWEKRKYSTNQAYSDSKLANILFVNEFAQRFANDANAPMIVAAHPGWVKTELQRHSGVLQFFTNIMAQGADMGALPTLRAAVESSAISKDYFGPANFFATRGHPVKATPHDRAYDKKAACQLWEISEKMTGVKMQPFEE